MEVSLLRVAASGLRAQQVRVDAASQNLANVETTGFRAGRPELIDLPSLSTPASANPLSGAPTSGDQSPGVSVERYTWPDLPGPTLATGAPLDVALPDGVYLAVRGPDGQTAYTRSGHLTTGSDGTLQVDDFPLVGAPKLGPNDGAAFVDRQGQIVVAAPTGNRVLGSLPLVAVPHPEELTPIGHSLLATSAQSGAPVALSGPNVVGLTPQAVEGSNVQIDQEMTTLLRAQRAYQANTRMVQTWDMLVGDTIQGLGHS